MHATSPQNDPKYLTAPLLSPPYSLVQPNSNINGTPPKMKENIKLLQVGSNSKKDSKILQVANSTAHHNFNMYRHSAAAGGYNYSGGSDRRNSSLGAATAGTDDGGSLNGGSGNAGG